jgi:hypothetical protein
MDLNLLLRFKKKLYKNGIYSSVSLIILKVVKIFKFTDIIVLIKKTAEAMTKQTLPEEKLLSSRQILG